MIKNIVFDMGGVLLDYNPPRFISRLTTDEADAALLLREVFNSAEWFRLDQGTIGQAEAAAAMCSRLPAHLRGAAERLIEWWKLEMQPVEGMAELVAELKDLGCGIYLLSNATVRQPEYFDRLPSARYFDGRFVSAFYKMLKPQYEIYEAMLKEFGLKAEECFFVDDSAANVEGARRAGIAGTVFDGDVERLREVLSRAGVPVRMGQN
ncbi:MAG: HAD family phosphatase [Oscillibacter sp.]|nr:HAD family phosphatase [Oscillibacter sp.]